MIKQEIISIIQGAHEIHSKLLDFGQILIDGINLDTVDEPINCFDCDFSHQLKTDGAVFSGNSWYQELQKDHEDLHQAYSDLYYESHRMYKPKTLDELTQLLVLLENKSKQFKIKLDEIEIDFQTISDDDYQAMLNNTKDTGTEKTDLKTKQVAESDKPTVEDSTDTLELETIDIEQHEEDQIQLNEVEAEIQTKTIEKDQQENQESEVEAASTNTLEPSSETKNKVIRKNSNASANMDQHINLKEQDIEQLKQEKELSQLELTHLEERQKLTQQGVEQLDQYYTLKQQEIESEKVDHDKLLEFKNKERVKKKDQLSDIDLKKVELKKVIQDLIAQNKKDQLELEEDQKSKAIKKQFDELKQNKTVELDNLEQHLQNKEEDLKQLKEQLRLLEQEVSEIQQDITKKEQDLEVIREKEQLKNEERAIVVAEQEKISQQCLDSIGDRQKELDTLEEQTQTKQNELEVIDFQIEDLHKNTKVLAQANEDDLENLTHQQDEKRKKLHETNKLKSTKQEEIAEIDTRIEKAEHVLDALKSPLIPSEEELAPAD